jgi:hypothetical protein
MVSIQLKGQYIEQLTEVLIGLPNGNKTESTAVPANAPAIKACLRLA